MGLSTRIQKITALHKNGMWVKWKQRGGVSVKASEQRKKRWNLEGLRGSLNSVTTKEGHREAGGCFQDRFSLKVGSRTEAQNATRGLWPLSGLDLLQTYHLKRNDNLWALVTLDTWKNIQSPLGIHELLGKQAVCQVLFWVVCMICLSCPTVRSCVDSGVCSIFIFLSSPQPLDSTITNTYKPPRQLALKLFLLK